MRILRWLKTPGLVAAAFVGGAVTSHYAEATGEKESPYLPFDQLARVMVVVESEYVDPAERTKLVEGAIKGMVSELDPHSAYMTAEDFELFQGDTDGQFGGVGVEVEFKDDYVTVIAPIENSPAERAGVKAGDQIIAVDGRPTRGVDVEELVTIMRGAPGSKIRVSLKRKDVETPITVDLVREVIEVKSVIGRRLNGDIAYIRLKQFQAGSHEALLDALGDIRDESTDPLRGVILDMRFNPGGLVDQAEGIADEFLSSGLIYSTRHRGQVIDQVYARSGGAASNLPVVVMVNEYSASASELVAGALKDAGRARIVGGQTFGKGSVQTIYDLPDGAGLRLTTMRYYTPAGRAIQAAGIQPHVAIHFEGEPDPTEILREADLDGALYAEGSAPIEKPERVVKGPTLPDRHPIARVAEQVSVDPLTGDDFALKTAYEEMNQLLQR